MSKRLFSSIFSDLSKNQLASFFSYIKIFVKKYSSSSCDEIWEKFVDEQLYSFAINSPRFYWIKEVLDNSEFEKNVKILIKENLKKITYRKQNDSVIEQKKLYIKSVKEKMLEWRQSKEKPTIKQIKYYNFLCRQLNVDNGNLDDKSKLDLKRMISELLLKRNGNEL